MCIEHKELIIRSFRKCGITTALDGSEDSDINIRGLENYEVRVEQAEIGPESQESDVESDTESESEEEGDFTLNDKHSEPTVSCFPAIRLGEEIS